MSIVSLTNPDILTRISEYLDPSDLARLACTHSALHALICAPVSIIWKTAAEVICPEELRNPEVYHCVDRVANLIYSYLGQPEGDIYTEIEGERKENSEFAQSAVRRYPLQVRFNLLLAKLTSPEVSMTQTRCQDLQEQYCLLKCKYYRACESNELIPQEKETISEQLLQIQRMFQEIDVRMYFMPNYREHLRRKWESFLETRQMLIGHGYLGNSHLEVGRPAFTKENYGRLKAEIKAHNQIQMLRRLQGGERFLQESGILTLVEQGELLREFIEANPEASQVNLSNALITEIPEEIQLFPGLRFLNLEGNPISSLLGIQFPDSLEYLQLSHTRISNLDGVQFPASLEELYVSHTGISSLAGVQWPASLKELWVSHTRISNLDGVQWPADLRVLDVSHTGISSLAGVQFPDSLEDLDVSYTGISSFAGVQFPDSLEDLDVSYTRISSLDAVRWPASLVYLRASSTEISSLDGVQWPASLEFLYD